MYRIRDYLRAEGLEVWTDEKMEAGTRSWKQAIEQALEAAACLVVILSPSAKQSEWVREEMDYAEAHDVRIFPVLASGTERRSIPFGFITAQRVDIRREEDFAAEMQKLVFTIRVHYVDLVESLKWGETPPEQAQPETIIVPPPAVPEITREPSATAKTRFPPVVNKAIMVLQNRDSKWWRRVDAINRLGELGNALALPMLETYLEDPDIDVQRAAQRAIHQIKNPVPLVDTKPEIASVEPQQVASMTADYLLEPPPPNHVPPFRLTPPVEALKLVISSPHPALRKEFIRAISEIEVISNEREIKPLVRQSQRTTTNISMDYGLIYVDDVILYLFGTPVQRRFDFMWQILAEGMLGYVVVLDAQQTASLPEVHMILETFAAYARVPHVIAVENHERPGSLGLDALRVTLNLHEQVSILPCKTDDPASVKNILLELSYQILEQTEN